LISAGASPQTSLGTSQRSAIPFSWILGVLTEGRKGEEKRKDRKKEQRGKRWRGRKGRNKGKGQRGKGR